jgi:hypothetical protein
MKCYLFAFILSATIAIGLEPLREPPFIGLAGKVIAVEAGGSIVRPSHIEKAKQPASPGPGLRFRGGRDKRVYGAPVFLAGVTNYPFGSSVDLIVRRTGKAKTSGTNTFEVFELAPSSPNKP